MSSRSTSLKIPHIIDETVRDLVNVSFEGNFNGFILSLIRRYLAGTTATAEEVFHSTPMSGIQRDRMDEEIVRMFKARLNCPQESNSRLPGFLSSSRTNAHPAGVAHT